MRIKEEIFATYEDDVSYHKGGSDLNPAIQGHIFLEVLIDIRDVFSELLITLGNIGTTLENIETNIRQGR